MNRYVSVLTISCLLVLSCKEKPTDPTAPTTAPILSSPRHGMVDAPINIDFVWLVTSDADAYQFQLSDSMNFSVLRANDDNLTVTSIHVNGLSNQTRYYWRVRGKNEVGYGPWSSTNQFMTVAPEAISSVPLVRPLQRCGSRTSVPVAARICPAPRVTSS